MFIGHFALGLAAKRATPRVSLAVLFAAAQLADLLWPIFVAIGFEQVRIDPGNTAVTPLDFVSYPFSHSLALLIVWGALFAWMFASHNRRAFSVLALLVVSHWVLDYVTHRPDMPLYPGGPQLGLGLWNSRAGTVALEVPMYLAGLWVYFSATRPRDVVGRWAFSLLAATLLVIYAGNLMGPPPPSVSALWQVAIGGSVLILAWSWWADRHRDAR
jgi:membrane-bound metal-dependent hydrolase YbcI (DUF457 family)